MLSLIPLKYKKLSEWIISALTEGNVWHFMGENYKNNQLFSLSIFWLRSDKNKITKNKEETHQSTQVHSQVFVIPLPDT